MLTLKGHPFILGLNDDDFFFVNDDSGNKTLVLITELANFSLEDYIKNNRGFLTEKQILKFFIQILLGA